MLKNPFETENNSNEESKILSSENKDIDLVMEEQNKAETTAKEAFPDIEIPVFNPNQDKYEYQPQSKQQRQSKRDVEQELTDEEYQERLKELDANAENKHYVLFFGVPASGKTWIIGSILHYMKNYIEGMTYLDSSKSTDSEEELFYQLQDRFNSIIGAKKITSTDTKQYFELHINFTPKDSSKPPMEIVFIDASGEHSEQTFRNKHNADSGKLPNYLTAILESKVNTKLAFVYDQSLQDEKDMIPQVNVLNAVFTQIQLLQHNQNKQFPKALLLSKSDRIFATDMATVERNSYDPMNYALEKIPSFANPFFNESPENKTIFYKMGKFSTNSDLILEFDKECPEKFFRWLYMQGTGGTSPIKEKTCWDKFMGWFKGEA